MDDRPQNGATSRPEQRAREVEGSAAKSILHGAVAFDAKKTAGGDGRLQRRIDRAAEIATEGDAPWMLATRNPDNTGTSERFEADQVDDVRPWIAEQHAAGRSVFRRIGDYDESILPWPILDPGKNLLRVDPTDFDYADAVSFTRWLIEQFGSAQIVLLDPDNKRTLRVPRPGNKSGMGTSRSPAKLFGPTATDEQILKWIAEHNRAGWNVYWSVNPTCNRIEKGDKEDVTDVVMAHVDADGDRVENAQRLVELGMSLFLDSGNGWWGFRLLDEPIQVQPDHRYSHPDDGSDWARYGDREEPYDDQHASSTFREIEARNRYLKDQFNGGDTAQNVDRIARHPGTINWPNAKKKVNGCTPTVSRLITPEGPLRTYSLDEMPADYGDKPKPVDVSLDLKLVHVDDLRDSPILSKLHPAAAQFVIEGCEVDVLRRVMEYDLMGNREKISTWIADDSRSEPQFFATMEMLRAGMSHDQVFSVLLDGRFGISRAIKIDNGQPRTRVEAYAKRQVERAQAELDAERSDHPAAPLECAFAANVDEMNITLEYDEFSERVNIHGLATFGPALDDAGMRRLRFRMSAVGEDTKLYPKELFTDLCLNHARYRVRHPVREYLDEVQSKWDGTSRVDTWLVDYFGAEDTKFNRAVSRIFLVAGVRRVRTPGCKYDEMLVLEGEQGSHKSTMMKRLAVDENWFSDDLPLNADGKKIIEQSGGRWIIECSELKGMKQGDIDSLKSTLSRTHDRARLSYDRLVSDVPRQWISVGTTNNRKYLKDQTGNRRFWPVETGRIDLERFTREIVDQLWAEAAVLEAKGESIRLDPALYDAAAQVQRERTADDPIVERLESALDELDDACITSEDLWAVLGASDPSRRTQSMNDRLGETMRRLRFERKHRRIGGRRQYVYQRGSEDPPHVPARFDGNGRFVRWRFAGESPDDTDAF